MKNIIKNKKKLLTILGVGITILTITLITSYIFRLHNVTFDSKGGTSVAAVRVMDGQTVSEPTTPLLPGYVFIGWYLNDELYDFSTPVTNDIILTGKWKSVTTTE